MSAIDTRYPINQSGVQALDLSKVKLFKAQEAPEGNYQRFIGEQREALKAAFNQVPDTAGNPTYEPYATVKVRGKIVAEIDNHGFVKTSNGVGGQIAGSIPGDVNGQTGPVLAQARAERIAELLGGEVVKSSTALTQSQFLAVPQPPAGFGVQALVKEPAFEQLQKIKEAKTLFLAQQFGQSGSGEQEKAEAAKNDTVSEFLEYMAKSPAERLYEAILKEKGLTKEQLESLPPEEQMKVEKEIQEEMEQRFEMQASLQSGEENS